MRPNFRVWPVLVLLSILSLPLVLMYFYLVVDTFTDTTAGSLLPDSFTLEHWKFLFKRLKPDGQASGRSRPTPSCLPVPPA